MSEQKNKKSSGIKTVVIAIFLVAIVLFYFNYLSNRSSIDRTPAEETELQQLMEHNMVGEYPKTPRDVVKLHCRYFKQFYGEELTDDELVVLNQQVRCLYSSDLLDVNPENDNLKALKKSIEASKDKYIYKSYALPEASQIEYYTQNGVEMATLEVTITVETEDSMGYLYEQYVLVEENDQWKILAWGESQMGE